MEQQTVTRFPVVAFAKTPTGLNIHYYVKEQARVLKCFIPNSENPPECKGDASSYRIVLNAEGKYVDIESSPKVTAGAVSGPMIMRIIQWIMKAFNMLDPFQHHSNYASGGMYVLGSDVYYLTESQPGVWKSTELTSSQTTMLYVQDCGFYVNSMVATVYLFLWELLYQTGSPSYPKLASKPFGGKNLAECAEYLSKYVVQLADRNVENVDYFQLCGSLSDLQAGNVDKLVAMIAQILAKDDKLGKDKDAMQSHFTELCKALNLNAKPDCNTTKIINGLAKDMVTKKLTGKGSPTA